MSDYPQPTCTHDPEDFHQRAINSGQRKINYKLTVVDKKLIEALKSLRDAVEKLANPTNPNNSTNAISADINAASNLILHADDLRRKVAEVKPPGCDET